MYIDSPYETIRGTPGPKGRLEELWIEFRYRDLYSEASLGSRRTREFLLRLQGLASELEGAPGVLADLSDELRTLVLPPVAAAAEGKRVLQLDRVFRGEAKRAILRCLAIVFEVDALISMALASLELRYCWPEVRERSKLAIQGVWHPFTAEPVPNDLDFTGQTRVVFLTGPNMGGKTTYLKSCSTALYLAHLGMGAPAAYLSTAPFDWLFTGFHIEDSLRDNTSFFQAEARRVKQIACAAGRGDACFVAMDEVFKGTNVKDAVDATVRVVTAFSRSRTSYFVISSHLFEALGELEENPAIRLRYVQGEVDQAELQFDYVVRDGSSSQRLGMRVLAAEGVWEALDQI